ncbi:hypothetical protein [Streptomyces phaeoluteigriseus]
MNLKTVSKPGLSCRQFSNPVVSCVTRMNRPSPTQASSASTATTQIALETLA